MIRAEGLLSDRQRALKQWLGLCVLTLGLVQRREVIQARGYIGMIWADRFLYDRQRTLEEWLGLRVLTLSLVQLREVIQAPGYIGMIWSYPFIRHIKSHLCNSHLE